MSDRGAAADKFLDASRPVNISKYVTVLVQAVMASAFFIYRCWLVHHQSWLVIAFPFVLWLGAVALMGIVIHVDTAFNITGLFAISQSKVFGSCFWAAIIAINIITTGQITWRIFRVDHRRSCSNAQLQSRDSMAPTLKAPTGNSMKLATHIAIESGMIYTIMTLVVFFLFVANSVAVYTAINILVPMIGIAFNLVIIHNRPRPQTSCLTELNSVPLQFTSSNLSVPASAIEFAYPKNFMPRRKKNTTEPFTAVYSVMLLASLRPVLPMYDTDVFPSLYQYVASRASVYTRCITEPRIFPNAAASVC
ncbi:hypothetical protein K438DRAFT_1798198 [Mycena galopus ATCC 62051]|nr:hypothetical protein K438DRAFT_1798198 [Mycena galopus ATCC 62051]